ncbi:MAG: hypothetical protein AB7T38_06435 [Nitrospirales bacterium]
MHVFMTSALIIIFLPSSLAQAADPHLTKQITVLQQQAVFPQQELNRLKNVITVGPDDTTRITAQRHTQTVTSGHAETDIGENQHLRIKGLSTEAIGESHSTMVGTDQTESRGQDLVQKIGKNSFQNAGLNVNIEAGKRMIISAGNQLILRTGQASIVLNKNGDISIEGKDIRMKGSVMSSSKDSKVTTNKLPTNNIIPRLPLNR